MHVPDPPQNFNRGGSPKIVKMPAVSPREALSKPHDKPAPDNLFDPAQKASPKQSGTNHFRAVSDTTLVANATAAQADNAMPGPTSISELARALKNNPDLIYQYVKNNVDLCLSGELRNRSRRCMIRGGGNVPPSENLVA